MIISDGNDTSSRTKADQLSGLVRRDRSDRVRHRHRRVWTIFTSPVDRPDRRSRCRSRRRFPGRRRCLRRQRSSASRSSRESAGSREPRRAPAHYRRHRRAHGSHRVAARSRPGDGEHRERAQPAVLPRLQLVGAEGRTLAHHRRRSSRGPARTPCARGAASSPTEPVTIPACFAGPWRSACRLSAARAASFSPPSSFSSGRRHGREPFRGWCRTPSAHCSARRSSVCCPRRSTRCRRVRAALSLLAGVLTFFLVEKLVLWHHWHDDDRLSRAQEHGHAVDRRGRGPHVRRRVRDRRGNARLASRSASRRRSRSSRTRFRRRRATSPSCSPPATRARERSC